MYDFRKLFIQRNDLICRRPRDYQGESIIPGDPVITFKKIISDSKAEHKREIAKNHRVEKKAKTMEEAVEAYREQQVRFFLSRASWWPPFLFNILILA